jgi:hypothetical protein
MPWGTLQRSLAVGAALLLLPRLSGRADPPKYDGPSELDKIIAPLPAEPPAPPKTSGPANNDIDRFIAARWAEFQASPAKLTDDYTFIRRVFLDIAGVIPTLEEVGRFTDSRKRVDRPKVVDYLLNSPRYADHWTSFWGDLLCEETNIEGAEPFAFRDYIRESLTANKPYDAWVREMITADGKIDDTPSGAFILRQRARPEELTIAVSQVFLGTQLKCAQCHDHPFEPWKQTDFTGMEAFWKGTQIKTAEVKKIETPKGTRERRVMEVAQRAKARGEGKFITGQMSESGGGREALAELITRRENPYFARVAVNRLWAKLMGTGLVNPPDGFSPRNPPSHPELLDYLAVNFVEGGYDLKSVIRLICNSRTYQLESKGGRRGQAPDDVVLFEKMQLRRLTAEQLHDSVLLWCGQLGNEKSRQKPAIEARYPAPPESFLATFGSHDRQTIHERDADMTIPQALELLNGRFVNQAARVDNNHPVRAWVRAGDAPGVVARKLFMQTLTREPTESELSTVLQCVGRSQDDAAWTAWADVHWALINTREFAFIR